MPSLTSPTSSTPWYRRTLRWGQTNLAEIDPLTYDHDFWKRRWAQTHVQGVIVNAGGIVAFYPSEMELHHLAQGVDAGRDLFGEVTEDARSQGLTVLARMDSNRISAELAARHPDWLAMDTEGAPYVVADKTVTCVNTPYYTDYIPDVLREIWQRSQPDGYCDNSWAGLPRRHICYCDSCARAFHDEAGEMLPAVSDWEDQTYRRWVAWSYRVRSDLWHRNNEVTQSLGGEHCLWMGMLTGNQAHAAERFIDPSRFMRNAKFVMLDHQFRTPQEGFHHNAETGKRMHELCGWDTLIPESMPMYALGLPAFRHAALRSAEVTLWSSSAFAGGILPWWHHIGAQHEDRRQYDTPVPIFDWHHGHEDVLIDRLPIADVGVVWSAENSTFLGRDNVQERTLGPYRGTVAALVDSGIAYLPVHADDIRAAIGRLRALFLPDLGVMSSDQRAAVQEFLAAGGGVVATGETGRYDEIGDPVPGDPFGRVLGVVRSGASTGGWLGTDLDFETATRHTYLRLHPSTAHGAAPRHPAFDGFDETDVLAFGGFLPHAEVLPGWQVLATLVPRYPIFPPETSWLREQDSGLPALVVDESSRVAYLLADVDRCADRERQADHQDLLVNLVRWAIGPDPTVSVETDGGVAIDVYKQGDRLVVHLVNDVATPGVPARQRRIIPSGPVRVTVAYDRAHEPTAMQRVHGGTVEVTRSGDTVSFTVPRVDAHEVVVLERRD